MLRRRNFSLTQIEYVLALHRLGSFSRAAQECHVTQPTLSVQIQKLEEELGVVIFERTKKPLLVTERGAALVAQMQAILAEARKIDEIVEFTESKGIEGELSLGVIPTVAPYLLPRLLPIVASQHPGLKLKIVELQTHRIVQQLQDDQLDVGLLATPLHQPNVHERPLFLEPFSLLCQKGHRLSQRSRVNYDSLEFHDIWLLEEGHCLRHQVLDICALRKTKSSERQFQFESGSLETLKSLVQANGGYTLLPALATENLPSGVQLVPFANPIPAREIGLVTGRVQHKKNLQDALAQAILSSVPAAIRKLRKKDLELVPVS